jgi:hypothetical protein
MATLEFSAETKRQVSNAIDDALCYSKPLVGDEAELALRKIIRMSLRLKGGMRDEPVGEWFERDLRGPHISLDSVVRIVERVCCHDASFQPAGDIIYELAFHSKDHDNRSRFMFKVYGGQETQSMVLSGPGGRAMGMYGGAAGAGGLNAQFEAGIAERLMPAVLEYVSKKEARLDDRTMHLLDIYQKREVHHDSVRQAYTDKETAVREIEIAARGLEYEQKKKEKADEEAEAFKKKIVDSIFAGLEKHGPKLMVMAMSMLQRRGGESLPPEFNEWYQEQKRAAKTSKPKTNGANGVNGAKPKAASPPETETASAEAGTETKTEDAKVEEEEAEEVEEGGESEDGEPSELDKLRLSVALQTASFFALVRARGKEGVIREALEPGPLQLWDAIADASSSEDAASDQGIALVAHMALMLGAMIQSDPGVGIVIHQTLDDFCKVAAVSLVKLLEEYHQAGGT